MAEASLLQTSGTGTTVNAAGPPPPEKKKCKARKSAVQIGRGLGEAPVFERRGAREMFDLRSLQNRKKTTIKHRIHAAWEERGHQGSAAGKGGQLPPTFSGNH